MKQHGEKKVWYTKAKREKVEWWARGKASTQKSTQEGNGWSFVEYVGEKEKNTV